MVETAEGAFHVREGAGTNSYDADAPDAAKGGEDGHRFWTVAAYGAAFGAAFKAAL